MGLSMAGRNARLNGMAADYDTMSLHLGDPGDTGLNECAGGSPLYARQPVSWGAASGGSIGFATAPVFNVEKDDTVTYVGFWSGSIFMAGYPIDAQAFNNQGTLTFDSFTISQPA